MRWPTVSGKFWYKRGVRPPPKPLSKPIPFAGKPPNPRKPALVRAPRIDVGDLMEIFKPLPTVPKRRTAPAPRPRPPVAVIPRRLPQR